MEDALKNYLADIEIICKDCGKSFTWLAGEQEFYKSKGLQPPGRCRPCRQAKKDSIAKYPPPRREDA